MCVRRACSATYCDVACMQCDLLRLTVHVHVHAHVHVHVHAHAHVTEVQLRAMFKVR